MLEAGGGPPVGVLPLPSWAILSSEPEPIKEAPKSMVLESTVKSAAARESKACKAFEKGKVS